MGQARYVVDAILFEGRSPAELARTHTLSRSWIYKLVDRYKAGGYDALEPRSRRPRSCSHQVGPEIQEAILNLRSELTTAGHDAGAHTISYHLASRVEQVPSVSTIWRILTRSVGRIFGKLGLLPDLDDERRVLAVTHHVRGG